MTIEEALKKMQAVKTYMTSGNPIWSVTEIGEAFDMAIESLEQSERGMDEWCTDCKEYNQEKHCCPRYNRVIRETIEEVQKGQKKGKWVEKFDRIIRELGVNCAYDMPSFWCNQGKDYKVIPTQYHKGYMQALADVEKHMKEEEE